MRGRCKASTCLSNHEPLLGEAGRLDPGPQNVLVRGNVVDRSDAGRSVKVTARAHGQRPFSSRRDPPPREQVPSELDKETTH